MGLEDTEIVLGESKLIMSSLKAEVRDLKHQDPTHCSGLEMEEARWKEREGPLGAECKPWPAAPKEIGSSVPQQQETGLRQPGMTSEALFLHILQIKTHSGQHLDFSFERKTWSHGAGIVTYGIVS